MQPFEFSANARAKVIKPYLHFSAHFCNSLTEIVHQHEGKMFLLNLK